MPSRAFLLAFAFFGFLFLWTVALLLPVPKETASEALGGERGMFFFGKALHVSAYAFLTLLGGSQTLTRRQRALILGLLSFHGFATEFFQQFVERTASWRDVGLDHIGILLGLLIGWRWWQCLCHKAGEPMSQ